MATAVAAPSVSLVFEIVSSQLTCRFLSQGVGQRVGFSFDLSDAVVGLVGVRLGCRGSAGGCAAWPAGVRGDAGPPVSHLICRMRAVFSSGLSEGVAGLLPSGQD
jgi:hypothetical protein